eukprot:m51a1_g14835 hypothetical protein (175) ;mRNA; f:717354-718085
MEQHRDAMRQIALDSQRHADTWETLLSQSVGTLSTLCALSSRFDPSSPAQLARLESSMTSLRRALALMRGAADGMARNGARSLEYFGGSVRGQGAAASCARGAVGGGVSAAECAEIALQMAAQYEREYWTKAQLIERIDYSRTDDIDGVMEQWAADAAIDKKSIRAALQRLAKA